MAAATAAAIVAATAATASAYNQYEGAKSMAKRERKASKLENALQSFRTQREKQQLVARMRQAQAMQLAQGVQSGAQQSSSLFGSQISTGSQAGSTMFAGEMASNISRNAATQRSKGAQAYNRSMAQASVFNAIGSAANLFTDDKTNKLVFG